MGERSSTEDRGSPRSWSQVRRFASPAARGAGFLGAAVLAIALALGLVLLGFLWPGIFVASVALLTVVIGAASPRAAAALDALGRGLSIVATAAVREILVAVIFVVAFVPAALYLRLRGRRRVLQRADRDATTYWERLQPGQELPRWEFSGRRWRGDSRGGGALARVVAFVALALVLNFAVGAWTAGESPLVEEVRTREASIAGAEANAGYPWIGDYWREHWSLVTEFVPYLGWQMMMPRQDALHIHTEGGVRRSYQAAAEPGAAPLRIAFYGGSTMWGYGARDEHTIPSEFARIAEREGVPVVVENHGMMGYTAFGSVVKYHLRRLEGDPVPDVVVSYDGINDFIWLLDEFSTPSGYRLSLAHSGPWSNRMANYLNEPFAIGRFVEHYSGLGNLLGWRLFAPDVVGPRNANSGHPARVAAAITRSHQMMSERGTIDGFAFFGFLQPIAATKRELTAGELAAIEATGGTLSLQLGRVYRILPQLCDANLVTDLTHVLDGAGSVYVDIAHISEEGNRLAAEAMFRHLRPTLAAMLRGGEPIVEVGP